MKNYKKRLHSLDVYLLCNRERYYTKGDNEEYNKMFDKCIGDITIDTLEEIATDIKEHSETDHDISYIMYLLNQLCYFVKEGEE
jgi:hypothetical protein